MQKVYIPSESLAHRACRFDWTLSFASNREHKLLNFGPNSKKKKFACYLPKTELWKEFKMTLKNIEYIPFESKFYFNL